MMPKFVYKTSGSPKRKTQAPKGDPPLAGLLETGIVIICQNPK